MLELPPSGLPRCLREGVPLRWTTNSGLKEERQTNCRVPDVTLEYIKQRFHLVGLIRDQAIEVGPRVAQGEDVHTSSMAGGVAARRITGTWNAAVSTFRRPVLFIGAPNHRSLFTESAPSVHTDCRRRTTVPPPPDSADRHLRVRSRFASTLGVGQNAVAERPEQPSGQRSMPRAWFGPRLR